MGGRQRQATGYGQACIGVQALQQAAEHGRVAVGGFDPQLGLPGFERQRLQLFQADSALSRVLRQVTHKGEILAIEAAGGAGWKNYLNTLLQCQKRLK